MAADVDALHYPYIRVSNVEWLKRTLVLFPHAARMTPNYQAPADDPVASEYVETQGTRGPLLRSARLDDAHVYQAQLELKLEFEQLRERHGPHFFAPFTRGRFTPNPKSLKRLTVWERRLSGHFQIHKHKMYELLLEYLLEKKLAWPAPPGEYSDGPNYVEMHPALGEAVMATPAAACAENECLRVVTEFPRLQGRLIDTPRKSILQACLAPPEVPEPKSGREIAEFLVYRRCDASALTPERIAALKEERDALVHFRAQLETLAATLPPTILSEPTLQKRLDALVDDIFVKWRQDQANLSSYARNLFGKDPLKEPEKLIDELVKSIVKPEGATAVVAGAEAGLHLGHLTLNTVARAVAGFAVAIIFRAARVWQETRDTARASPYRYLTALQQHGVAFRLAGKTAEGAEESANYVP